MVGGDQLMQNDDARVRWLHAQKITIRDNDKGIAGLMLELKKFFARTVCPRISLEKLYPKVRPP